MDQETYEIRLAELKKAEAEFQEEMQRIRTKLDKIHTQNT